MNTSTTPKKAGRPKMSDRIVELEAMLKDKDILIEELEQDALAHKDLDSDQPSATEMYLLSEIADLEAEYEEVQNELHEAKGIIAHLAEDQPDAEPEQLTQSCTSFDLDPNAPAYHARLILSKGIEPVSKSIIGSGIKNPTNLMAVPDATLMTNFGLSDVEARELHVSCEDFSTVYLFKWEDIQPLGLSYDNAPMRSGGFFGYSAG